MPREFNKTQVKNTIRPKVEEFIDWAIDRIEDSNITADEVPGLVEAGVGVGKTVVVAVADKRLDFGEVVTIWDAIATFRIAWRDARRD